MITRILDRRFALGAMAVLGAVTFASQASAQEANATLDFDGTVGSFCVFEGETAGTLIEAVNAGNPIGLETDPNAMGFAILTCNAPAELTVSAPESVSTPELGGLTLNLNSVASIEVAGVPTQVIGGNTTPTPIGTPDQAEITVTMTAMEGGGQTIPNGLYEFTVELTAAPQ